ncbi:hypothetical protein [Holzapfeliella floricola]|uniref:hypothetical protein n=1 Tax=Holzapfeliella floricola TaxID=679249 RepID=UPI000B2EFCBC|nr:hypothetical protein [Holzapfeliella floricola]
MLKISTNPIIIGKLDYFLQHSSIQERRRLQLYSCYLNTGRFIYDAGVRSISETIKRNGGFSYNSLQFCSRLITAYEESLLSHHKTRNTTLFEEKVIQGKATSYDSYSSSRKEK